MRIGRQRHAGRCILSCQSLVHSRTSSMNPRRRQQQAEMKAMKNILLVLDDSFTMHHSRAHSNQSRRGHVITVPPRGARTRQSNQRRPVPRPPYCASARRVGGDWVWIIRIRCRVGGEMQCLHGAFLSDGPNSRMTARVRWIVTIMYIHTRRSNWKQFRCTSNRNCTISKVWLNKR